MWETQLRISYKDYKLENTGLLEEQVRDLIYNISPFNIFIQKFQFSVAFVNLYPQM